MIKSCNINNIFVQDGLAIAIQVFLIFTFLTLFFFFYVVKIEKEEFEKQINIIVDDMMEYIIQNSIHEPIPNMTELNIIINGILSSVEQSIVINSSTSIRTINNLNEKIKKDAFKKLYLFGGVIFTILLSFLIIGFCFPFTKKMKEILIVVFFVAVTEFTFLNTIAANYISVDPNQVRVRLGTAIQTWIKKNKST